MITDTDTIPVNEKGDRYDFDITVDTRVLEAYVQCQRIKLGDARGWRAKHVRNDISIFNVSIYRNISRRYQTLIRNPTVRPLEPSHSLVTALYGMAPPSTYLCPPPPLTRYRIVSR